ncbi:hypothetical protein [uncultured Halomonas sp.]|uniref:hypothetical protein n=1 Tax=uncultured Halomonas sp. TaxID=173971 RepID=UPI00261A4160|nr:hypothetical protein [uncultured Halomonas sp.]
MNPKIIAELEELASMLRFLGKGQVAEVVQTTADWLKLNGVNSLFDAVELFSLTNDNPNIRPTPEPDQNNYVEE